MFGEVWNLEWDPNKRTLEPDTIKSDLLNWIRTSGVITATSADWFFTGKRESKEALKHLVDNGAIWKGSLRSSQKKITIYACDPRPSVEECVRQLIVEKFLDVLLDRFPEVAWAPGKVKIGQKVWLLRVAYQNAPSLTNGERDVIWIGDDWERLKEFASQGHLASTLELFKKGLVMRLQDENWIPDHNLQSLQDTP